MIQSKWFIDEIVKEKVSKCVYLKRFWKEKGDDSWLGERLVCKFVDALEILQVQERTTVIEIEKLHKLITSRTAELWQDNLANTVSCIPLENYTFGDNNNETEEFEIKVTNFIPSWIEFVESILRR